MLQGVMSCPECKNKLQVRISADDVSFFFGEFADAGFLFITLI
jgi:hypothetical protein